MKVQYEPPATTWLAGKRAKGAKGAKKIKDIRSSFFLKQLSATSGIVSAVVSVRIAPGRVGDDVLGQAVFNTFVDGRVVGYSYDSATKHIWLSLS